MNIEEVKQKYTFTEYCNQFGTFLTLEDRAKEICNRFPEITLEKAIMFGRDYWQLDTYRTNYNRIVKYISDYLEIIDKI